MSSVARNVARQKVFCRNMLAVAEPTARLDDLGRQPPQLRKVLQCDGRSLPLAGGAQQSFEHRPTRGKRRIEPDCTFEQLDRTRGIAERNMAVTALLEKQAVVWVGPLEGTQCLQCLARLTKQTQVQR